MKSVSLKILAVAVLFGTAACSQRPVLYDNAMYQKSPEKAKTAIETCVKKAEDAEKAFWIGKQSPHQPF